MGVEGVRVMPGSGESSKSKQGVDRVVQIYDKGVENGDLTTSHGSKWADTLSNREEEVATTTFWGQIATYLTSMEYREGTTILCFNQLFNLARQHFFVSFESGQAKGVISSWSKGGTVQRTCGAREGRFFVEQGRDGSEVQRNVRRTCSESIFRVSSPKTFPLFHLPHRF
jgi:hypothetical protein